MLSRQSARDQSLLSARSKKPAFSIKNVFRSNLAALHILLAASFALFFILNDVVQVNKSPTAIGIGLLLAATLPGMLLTTSDIPRQFTIVVFAVNGCCLFYLVGMHATYKIAGVPLITSVWVPVVLALLAFRWPTLVVFPAMAVRWTKLYNQSLTGLGAPDSADFAIIPDLALFLTLLIGVYAIYHAAKRRWWAGDKIDAVTYFNASVIMASGVHLSNYFHSGWGKLFLPGSTPLTWVLENPTYILAINATDVGAVTIFNMLPGSNYLVQMAVWTNVPLNVFVLVIQLLAIVCLLSLRGTAWLTFLYDIMHVGIFILTGIFFWKWIVLNASFIVAFRRMSQDRPPSVIIRLVGCGVVLAAPLVFHIQKLAWFDTGGMNDAFFEVLDDGGNRVRVPSNYFLDKSINAAQARFVIPKGAFLPTGTWGTVGDGQAMKRLVANCPAEAKDWSLTDEQKQYLTTLVRSQHALATRLADDSGHVAYDLYPHHIWSAPWLFNDFKRLDVRKIRSYFFVMESRCVTLGNDGSATRNIVGRESYEVKL